MKKELENLKSMKTAKMVTVGMTSSSHISSLFAARLGTRFAMRSVLSENSFDKPKNIDGFENFLFGVPLARDNLLQGVRRGSMYGVAALTKKSLNAEGDLRRLFTPPFKRTTFLANEPKFKVKPEYICKPRVRCVDESYEGRRPYYTTHGKAVLETDAALKQRGIIK